MFQLHVCIPIIRRRFCLNYCPAVTQLMKCNRFLEQVSLVLSQPGWSL